jgi:hypothetical protein
VKFRKVKPDDIPAVIELAIESVSKNPLPVTVDRAAMLDMGKTLMNPAHFAWLAEDDDGNIVASVAALVQQGFWFSRLQCSVLLYYSRVPGAGLPLLRELARWVKSRSGIKLAIIELEPDADPRLIKFLKRLGFGRESTNLCFVRGESK